MCYRYYDRGAGELRVGFDRVKLPRPAASLSGESLVSDGAFLLFDGVETFLWFGRAVPPGLLEALFGTPTLDGVDLRFVSMSFCLVVCVVLCLVPCALLSCCLAAHCLVRIVNILCYVVQPTLITRASERLLATHPCDVDCTAHTRSLQTQHCDS